MNFYDLYLYIHECVCVRVCLYYLQNLFSTNGWLRSIPQFFDDVVNITTRYPTWSTNVVNHCTKSFFRDDTITILICSLDDFFFASWRKLLCITAQWKEKYVWVSISLYLIEYGAVMTCFDQEEGILCDKYLLVNSELLDSDLEIVYCIWSCCSQ